MKPITLLFLQYLIQKALSSKRLSRFAPFVNKAEAAALLLFLLSNWRSGSKINPFRR